MESLAHILGRRAAEQPERQAFSFVRGDREQAEQRLTYGELDRRARAVAGRLQRVAVPGDRALLLYPPGLEFAAAFYGCLYAGVVAVPAPPPDPARLARTLPRIASILGDAQPAVVLTTAHVAAAADAVALPPAIATDELDLELARSWRRPASGAGGETLVYLQFTSGSTSAPKGVMSTEANLLHNCRGLQQAWGYTEESVAVMWVPNFHDDGLVHGTVLPVVTGHRCILMPPLAVVQEPERWLRAISRFRATHSGGPNFIYSLAARKVRPGARGELDLASWRMAYNAAEPVRHETLVRFHRAFSRCGFRWDAFYPAYGLAETTLLLSTRAPDGEPVLLDVDAAALERRRVVESRSADRASLTLVSSGRPIAGTEVRIVDPETRRPCGTDEVGEIWVANPSVARGYFRREEATEETFRARIEGVPEGLPAAGPFLRTGDLGFLAGGELFVTGRCKDLILVRGRNVYPQDVEATVEASHPLLRPGCSAAFSVEVEAEERLVVIAEIGRNGDGSAAGEVIGAVRRAVTERHELPLQAVTLLAPGGVLKTSSGKLRRRACRQAFLDGTLRPIGTWRAGGTLRAEPPPPAEVPEGGRPRSLRSYLRDLLARELGLTPAEVDPDEAPRIYGIDSLKDVELVNRVREDLGLELAPASFLAAERLGDLAERLAAADPQAEAPRIPRQRRREDGWPLSPAQERLYFLYRLMPGNPSYNVPFFLRFSGSLSPALLAAVLGELVRRHETLRAVFTERAGKPLQAVRPWSPVRTLPQVDLGALPPARRGREARRLARREAARPFDLEAGPLWRAPLLRLGEEEHFLLLAFHHVSVDGASLGVLYRELGTLYEAFRAGRPSPLPRPAVRYFDYAVWQRRRLSGERSERLFAEWREELRDLPALELPADRPRPAMKGSRSESFTVALGAEASRSLRELGRRCQATPAMTLAAVFGVLLARAAGQERFVVGTPVANRGAREVEGLVGCFVNVLPLPFEVPAAGSFRELLGRVREKALAAWARQELPFEALVDNLGLPRDLSRNPLFQVIFALQNVRLDPLELAAVTAEPRLAGYQPARFDLEVHLWDLAQGFSGFCSYDTDLFDATTVSRLTRRFASLAGAAAEDPGRRIGDLPWLAAAERHQLLTECSAAPLVEGEPSTIFELFAARAAESPDAVALLGGPDAWSYGELADRARRLARVLVAHFAVGPETRVGLFMERSPEAVAAIFGILAAGGAYVPLDPSHPAERLAYVLEDSGAAVLLTEERLLDGLPETAVPRLCLERAAVPVRDGRRPAARPENLAYVIYTSGSTGRPKGVGISHAHVTRLFSATASWFRFGPGDVRTLFHSVAFDFSVWEIFGALLHGGRLVIVPWETSRSPEAFYELLRERRVTVLDQTPSAFEALLRECGEKPPPPALRAVVFGGEALDPRRLMPWKTGPRFVNMYGITETTVHVTYRPLAGADLARGGSPIGRPIPDLGAVLLRGGREPAPLGVPGEIFVGGAGLARGYLGRSGLTAERFVPDPFAAAPGARLYRSGDLARRRADGGLDYLGRADHQVKIRGYRLELGEVEAVLRRHPAVREACVAVDGSPLWGARLVAYLAGAGAAPRELRAYLRRSLPEYMVPALFVELEALPRLPNGKVDRAALAPPRGPGPGPDGPALPENRAEADVAAIWREVLRLERVAPEEDFFELGGHSLALLEVRSRLETLGAQVPLARLFEARTVAAMARIVEEQRGVRTGTEGIPVLARRPEDGTFRFPASFAQQGLWFLERLGPRGPSPVYHLMAAFRLTGRLLVGALELAVAETARRHETLRTTFSEIDGEPWQVIRTDAAVLLPMADLGALPPAAREAELWRRARLEHDRPFDLASGPLWRFLLLRVAGGEHLLLAAHHHIVSDGWSFGVLFRELAACYEACAQGRRPARPAPPVQYADFAVWQRRRLSRGGEDALAWWQERLAGVPPLLALPADRPRRPVQRFRGALLRFAVGARPAAALAVLGRRESATPMMTLLAAFYVLLYRASGADRIVAGIPAAGRGRRELEDLIGFFVNNLALPADLSDRPAFRRLLGRVRETAIGAQLHQELPFERLVEELEPARDLSRHPLFQVVFAFQSAPAGKVDLAGLEMRPELAVFPSTRFDLELHVWETAGGLEGLWAWDLDLFDATTVARLSRRWTRLLEDVVRAPEATPDALGGPSAAERHQLAVEWNDTGPRSGAESLWALFEEQVSRTPEAVALLAVRSFDETAESVSYRVTRVRVLDRGRGEAPLGVAGELAIGGTGLARGYHGRPSLTAERFMPDAHGGLPGERLYRSGDLARWLADGSLELLGRARRTVDAGAAEPSRGALPGTATEAAVAAVWREVLPPRGAPFTADEDFFAAGGHSLLAVRVISRLRQRFGVELSIRDLFEAPTVAALARRVELARRSAVRGEIEPARRYHPAGAPLSFAQQRLWLLDRLAPGSSAYNMPLALRLRGTLDGAALERALGEIVRRHQVLRTTFALVDGEPVQKIRPPAERVLPVADLTALPAPVREAEVRRRAELDAARPFDLEAGPPFRASLLGLGAQGHVLLVNQHHAVSDGWSLDVFRSELEALYAAFLRGEASPLPEPRLQYADFAVWQRGWLAGEVLEAEIAWWKRELGAEPPVLELPIDHRRPAVQAFRGGACLADLPPPLCAALRELGRREGVSLMMTLLAGFFVLLHRVSGQGEILVGSPIANRDRYELEGLIGFFVNTLVLRGDLGPGPDGREPSFRELLGRVRRTCLAAYAHQDLPFEKLVEELALARDLSRNPVCQVTFTLGETAAPAWALPGVRVEPLELDVRSTHFDLETHLWPRDDGRLGMAFVFDRELFDPTTPGRLLRRFRRLLEAVAADPGGRLDELAWLGAAERHQALAEWSAGTLPPPAEGTRLAFERFLRHAEAAPDALALALAPPFGEPEQILTYGELRRRAGGLARRLAELGVGPDAVVAVVGGRSVETIAAYLAVFEAGGAYLPLDPGAPQARLEWMLRDSGAALVLAASGVGGRFAVPQGVPSLLLGGGGARPENAAAPVPRRRPHLGNLAYVIYTSGSTGRPKGVEIVHRGLCQLLDWQTAEGVNPEDRATHTAAVAFDASVLEIWPFLTAGASVHLLPEGDHPASSEHMAWLAERGITVSFVVPPLVKGLVAAEPPPGLRLRNLRTGGDVLQAHDRELPFSFDNYYGPTEITVLATTARVRALEIPPPIGRPIGRARIHVVDRGLRLVPAGVHGELLLGGEGLARGYRNRPALTAARFLPDSFGEVSAGMPGERLYRTGDRVRFLADGQLEFAGRLDRQVKVRGIRVELGEIEGVLASSPAVREAVVLATARVNGSGEARLLGCVVPAAGPADHLVVELRAHLERELPPAMVPAHLLILDSFPRTSSGKVDRRALARQTAAAAAERPQLANAFEAPRSEMEKVVAGLWREVLGLERVGVHDNFFEVGGHSLAMVQIRERLRQESARRNAPEPPSLVEMFQHPTVYRLAGRLSNGAAESRVLSRDRAVRQGQERRHARTRLASQLERRRHTPGGRLET